MREAGSQMSIGINIIVSMATCYVLGYWVSGSVMGDAFGKVGGHIVGLSFAIMIMVIETWLFIFRANDIDNDGKVLSAPDRRPEWRRKRRRGAASKKET